MYEYHKRKFKTKRGLVRAILSNNPAADSVLVRDTGEVCLQRNGVSLQLKTIHYGNIIVVVD